MGISITSASPGDQGRALGPEASLSKSVNGGRGTGMGSKENGVPSASNYLESAAYPEVGEGITSPLSLPLSQHTHHDLARSCLLGNLERQGPSPALHISFSESPRMNQSKSGSIFFFLKSTRNCILCVPPFTQGQRWKTSVNSLNFRKRKGRPFPYLLSHFKTHF